MRRASASAPQWRSTAGPTASWISTAPGASVANPACRPAPTTRSISIPRRRRRRSATTAPIASRWGSSPPASSCVRCRPSSPGVSTIARLVASQRTQVRKPEQGTQPNLFYVGPEEAALRPAMQERGSGYAFSQSSRIPVPGGANVAGTAPPMGAAGVDLLRMARTVYDVAHPERPWGWKVSTYLWTKSVAAGAFLVSALALVGGLASGGALTGLAAPLIGLVFLALTTALLVLDLKRPERFLFLFFRHNWRSWLVWGGWILLVFGAVGGGWLFAAWTGHVAALRMLAWPMVPLAAAAAGYSAFLFGQAEGRDFWQSPLL